MGFSFSPPMWFTCRLCRNVFPSPDKLKEHKLSNHLGDCLKNINTCIVFEEKLVDDKYDVSKLAASIKQYYSDHGPAAFSPNKAERQRQGRRNKRFRNPYVSITPLRFKLAPVASPRLVSSIPAVKLFKEESSQILPASILKQESPKIRRASIVKQESPRILRASILKKESSKSPEEYSDDGDRDGEWKSPSDYHSDSDTPAKSPPPSHSQSVFSTAASTPSKHSAASKSKKMIGPKSKMVSLKKSPSKSSEAESPPGENTIVGKTKLRGEIIAGNETQSNSNSIESIDMETNDSKANSGCISTETEPIHAIFENDADVYEEVIECDPFAGQDDEEEEEEEEVEEVHISSEEDEGQTSTYPSSMKIPTAPVTNVREKTNAIPYPESENIEEDDIDWKLDLEIPLRQWLRLQKNRNPTNKIFLEPDLLDPLSNELDFNVQNPVKCKLCATAFTFDSDLRAHVLKCWHFEKQKHRYCIICDFSFTRASGYRRHIRTLHSQIPRHIFKCPTCSKEFLQEYSLVVHQDLHNEVPDSNLRPYKCPKCDLSFAHYYHLKRHIKSHSAERPWVCKEDRCRKSFKRKTELQRHSIVHGKTSRYMCSYCQKPCHSREKLEDHERTHTGDRPYICEVAQCGKAFTKKHNLNRHQHSRHGTELNLDQIPCPYESKGCFKKFGFQSQLKYHLESKHGQIHLRADEGDECHNPNPNANEEEIDAA